MQSTAEHAPDALLTAVLDNVGVALVVIDDHGRFVFTNQAARRMFGTESLSGLSLEEWRRKCVFRDSKGRPIPPEQAPIVLPESWRDRHKLTVIGPSTRGRRLPWR